MSNKNSIFSLHFKEGKDAFKAKIEHGLTMSETDFDPTTLEEVINKELSKLETKLLKKVGKEAEKGLKRFGKWLANRLHT